MFMLAVLALHIIGTIFVVVNALVSAVLVLGVQAMRRALAAGKRSKKH